MLEIFDAYLHVAQGIPDAFEDAVARVGAGGDDLKARAGGVRELQVSAVVMRATALETILVVFARN